MDLLRISLVQMVVIWENPVANRQKLDQLLQPLTGMTDLIVLPEMFTTGFSVQARELAEPMSGETVGWMKLKAQQTGAAIAGSLIIKENGIHFNRFIFVHPSGQINQYDKRHLFSMGGENQYFDKGRSKDIIQYKGWRIALFVCYDLRFPVWCRSISTADLMLFAANWPEKRNLVWQTLIRARAIENQLYVVGVNRTGLDGNGITYSGESTLIDAKGFYLLEMGQQPDRVATCPISLDELNRFREKFPVAEEEDRFSLEF